MKLRPCIDIHDGQVKQIVGSTIRDLNGGRRAPIRSDVEENFVSFNSADFFASIYRKENLPGGHIILLNSAEREPLRYEADRQQALSALQAYPGGMQIGGGMNPTNAELFLEAGASHIIVTSYVFREGQLDASRLGEMQDAVGREHLVLDLSCRRKTDGSYVVVTDRWQKETELTVDAGTLDELSTECDEILVHAADVEGRRAGIETDLAGILGRWLAGVHATGRNYAVTYAGGVHALSDVDLLRDKSDGTLDFTVGSALDLFGGELSLAELMEKCR